MSKKSIDFISLSEKPESAKALPLDVPATEPLVRPSTERLLHELQVHQIELEMQNEELRCAYAALEASRDRFQELYDFAPVGYLTLTHNVQIAEINMTAIKLLGGEERNKILSRHFTAFIAPKDSDRWHLFFAGVMKQKNQQNIVIMMRRIDGTEFPVQLNSQYINSMQRITVTDLTEIKRTEAALREAEKKTLLHQQDIREIKLREQREKEHMNELAHVTRIGLMGEMASGIAHEVNQPLASISTYAQVSLNLINTEHPDLVKLAEILSKTQQQALRAGQIINNMRNFIKPAPKKRSTVDINTVIHNAAELCISEINQNSISLILELENNLPSIFVEQIQIEQVIINLIRNSIKALKDLSTKQQCTLSVHSHLTHDNAILVSVNDNGPGLSKDQQQKIMMPFYTTNAEGMGMGLSISRSLIEAHDGVLSFNSEPGQGSSFYFTLPTKKI